MIIQHRSNLPCSPIALPTALESGNRGKEGFGPFRARGTSTVLLLLLLLLLLLKIVLYYYYYYLSEI